MTTSDFRTGERCLVLLLRVRHQSRVLQIVRHANGAASATSSSEGHQYETIGSVTIAQFSRTPFPKRLRCSPVEPFSFPQRPSRSSFKLFRFRFPHHSHTARTSFESVVFAIVYFTRSLRNDLPVVLASVFCVLDSCGVYLGLICSVRCP